MAIDTASHGDDHLLSGVSDGAAERLTFAGEERVEHLYRTSSFSSPSPTRFQARLISVRLGRIAVDGPF